MITLCILDGFGVNKNELGNAVAAAGTPKLALLPVPCCTTVFIIAVIVAAVS